MVGVFIVVVVALGVQVAFVAMTVGLATLRGIEVVWASVGLGPPLWRRRLGTTEWRVGTVPLGSSAALRPEDPATPPTAGRRWLDDAPWGDQMLLRMGPWCVLGGVAVALRPWDLGSLPKAWVLAMAGPVQPLSLGAETVRASWDLVMAGAPSDVAVGTLTALVAVNLLPCPPLSLGQALVVALPEASRTWAQVLGVALQVAWLVGWSVAGVAAWLR